MFSLFVAAFFLVYLSSFVHEMCELGRMKVRSGESLQMAEKDKNEYLQQQISKDNDWSFWLQWKEFSGIQFCIGKCIYVRSCWQLKAEDAFSVFLYLW